MQDISRRLFTSSVVGATATLSVPSWATPFDLAEEVRGWIESKFDGAVKIDKQYTPSGTACVAYSIGWAAIPKNSHERMFEGLKTLHLSPNDLQISLAKTLSDIPSTATVYWREYPNLTVDGLRRFDDGKEHQCEKLYFRMAIE